ncbi:MAG: RsmE family RNA methyltransferase [Cyclobacteriaceae bacterium]
MNLHYQPDFTDQSTVLSGEESYHVTTVLRKKIGDVIYITDGLGSLFHCKLTSVHPERSEIRILKASKIEKQKPSVHLLISVLKTSERMEWLTEKAVELGVASVTFYVSDRTERKNLNTAKLSKIAISAIKQSGRCWLPAISGPVSFHEAINLDHSQKFVASLATEPLTSLFEHCSLIESTAILIGPEGDLTPDEIEMAQDKSFIPVTLGKYTLRSETAALAALQTVMVAGAH